MRQFSCVGLGNLLILAAVFLVGCGPGGPEVVKVHGTVTRKGAPVPNVMVIFQPTQGRPSKGVTDSQGNYSLRYTKQQDGARVGPHKVFVDFASTAMAGPEAEMAMLAGKPVKGHPDEAAITKKYGTVDVTPLNVEVKDDGQEINLTLD